ncbi:hypothetical protein COT44_03910 [Candidatus Shapirobacteria bacterium CG08_land_8_20_14_0_20_39_18]|uniref:Uncharacterized protein n=1 Tax=Candidatus Shapirobacteria bacterium CG08_land_8_20_14_0_20_39_18 TaxID=1974883 RepID=A0A2M6XCC9_9BACT|nr:MAG: hypothetical protein COT44_03910 [Candidatus Shapirobacteria bacterium CG08_land_8_20_14_0_20_39_18]PIY65568.1 MAG: hypothetical protein COY91_02145 [Candidatus Shapirobacteria bacterium CG_4_10_14_0_8_um_filter_39_15]
MKRIYTILIVLFILSGILLLLSLLGVPPLSGRNGLLRVCRFNEQTAKNDVCRWVWDKTLNQPSIYF